jgi:hypothetical protein
VQNVEDDPLFPREAIADVGNDVPILGASFVPTGRFGGLIGFHAAYSTLRNNGQPLAVSSSGGPYRAGHALRRSARVRLFILFLVCTVFCLDAAFAADQVSPQRGSATSGAAGSRRAVVELFTSQGCSSCPPADALVGRLTADPTLLVLSFHVNYWDNTSWKDSFSSQASTDRQYAYARSLGEATVFTPQLIVDGARSVVGSRESDVLNAIKTSDPAHAVSVGLVKQGDGSFVASFGGEVAGATVWEVRYVRHSAVRVRGGENGGRELETYNNVVALRRVGPYVPGTLTLPALRQPEDGLALLVQKSSSGPIIGAAAL